MDTYWFWLLMFLLVFMILAWPTWPYTRERWIYRRGGTWRYAPSVAAALGALLIVFLFWFGLVVITLPWAAVAT